MTHGSSILTLFGELFFVQLIFSLSLNGMYPHRVLDQTVYANDLVNYYLWNLIIKLYLKILHYFEMIEFFFYQKWTTPTLGPGPIPPTETRALDESLRKMRRLGFSRQLQSTFLLFSMSHNSRQPVCVWVKTKTESNTLNWSEIYLNHIDSLPPESIYDI